MSETPDGFSEVSKQNGRPPAGPIVTLNSNRRKFSILKEAFEALDRPDAIRFFFDAKTVAFVPAPADHPDSYSVWSSGGGSCRQVSAGWLTAEGFDPGPGHYRLQQSDDGVHFIDFAGGPDE